MIAAVDLYSKWVEVETVASITEKAIIKFFKSHILARFGVPYILISDNGTQFIGKEFKHFCDELHIERMCTAVSHPMTNGQNGECK